MTLEFLRGNLAVYFWSVFADLIYGRYALHAKICIVILYKNAGNVLDVIAQTKCYRSFDELFYDQDLEQKFLTF